MPHPKRKISRTRRDKRRTHYKAEEPSMAECPQTGDMHLPHRATIVKEAGKKVIIIMAGK